MAEITVSGTGINGPISRTVQLEQRAYDPPTPPVTRDYVTYQLTSNLGQSQSVDLMIEITSKDRMTDSSTVYCTHNMTDSQDIDVYLESSGSTQITIDIDASNIVNPETGNMVIRATYGHYDSGYRAIVNDNVISLTATFLDNTPLIIEVLSGA